MTPLVVENVHKTYRSGERVVNALQGVSIDVRQGQFLAIMGASGSGKSTLLHLMAGLTQADQGKVVIAGTDVGQLGDHALTLFRRKTIGLVFQSFNLIPTLTARENVELPLLLNGKPTTDHRARADDLLKRLGLGERGSHRPDGLSGGEQQRVAIGRALVTDPAVILADEPTGNLDSANSRAVCELLRDLSVNQGKTIVMVTHEPTVAAYAHEVAVLKDGKLLKRFTTGGPEKSLELAAMYQEAIR
ncbi:MAG: ABC transporter ATP-binding protein [Tepidisphaeraceae bacterium]